MTQRTKPTRCNMAHTQLARTRLTFPLWTPTFWNHPETSHFSFVQQRPVETYRQSLRLWAAQRPWDPPTQARPLWGPHLSSEPRQGEKGAVQHRGVQVALHVQDLLPCGGELWGPSHLQGEAGSQLEAIPGPAPWRHTPL